MPCHHSFPNLWLYLCCWHLCNVMPLYFFDFVIIGVSCISVNLCYHSFSILWPYLCSLCYLCCVLTLDRAGCSICVNKLIAGRICVNDQKCPAGIRSGRTLRRRICGYKYTGPHRVTVSLTFAARRDLVSNGEGFPGTTQRCTAHKRNNQSSVFIPVLSQQSRALEFQSGRRGPSSPLAKTDWERLVKEAKTYCHESEFWYNVVTKISVNIAVSKFFIPSVCLRFPISVSLSHLQSAL